MSDRQTTGRMIVVLGGPQGTDAVADLRQIAGITRVASTTDFSEQAVDMADVASAEATVYAELGVAVVAADADQTAALRADVGRRIVAVEPELILYARGADGSPDYVRGYRDGVTDLSARLTSEGDATRALQSYSDTDAYTWGLQAVGVDRTTVTGAGSKVAVLDTGFTFDHPDFAGRTITSQSFVAGEEPADGQGHGTHCVGTITGPAAPAGSRRYGVAPDVDIHVGKVLGNNGSGSDAGILAGINWALASGCQVVSMSLGANVREPSAAYERVGSRALAAGTLIVAAAGNNAKRPDDPGFVGVPANSPSIMAVAAVDHDLQVAPFSAAGTTVEGGQIDVAAPGVDVYSSWLLPQMYNTISGTSMATPHVAGLAALWHQQSGATGRDLWTLLTQHARRLGATSQDVGSGLCLAP
ncbi:S8 family serine peptidase [Williamsia sterculiae]|uniref:Subtilase family protein n=1 Tax=Williamsia sterculiae TaxID=1344003 RepID=A0A1N7H3H7_9NOCA|nr:S8 family serine peptidase [Williamsia sterculiae]SIS19395.1 Subtilase family protein [Williamsia sterculiae]